MLQSQYYYTDIDIINYVTFNNHPRGRENLRAARKRRHCVPLFSRAFSHVRAHFRVSCVLARRTTKKERLQVVYNKTAVHVLVVVEQNPLPPSLLVV